MKRGARQTNLLSEERPAGKRYLHETAGYTSDPGKCAALARGPCREECLVLSSKRIPSTVRDRSLYRVSGKDLSITISREIMKIFRCCFFF